MVKLIASDIDGTLLLNGERELSDRLFAQIHELGRRGVLFAAASGRQIPNLKRLFAPVAEEIAYIAENGALVQYKGEILFKQAIERPLGLEILADIKQRENCEILLSGADTSYLEPKTAEYEEHMRFFVKNNITIVPDIAEVKEDFLKISVYEKDGVSNSRSYFKDKWSDKVTVATSGYQWLDMVHKNVNKGNAICHLMKFFQFSPQECVAFGDNDNDLEMLDAVSKSYAMRTAQPGVAEHCKYVTDTVENAIAQLLEEV